MRDIATFSFQNVPRQMLIDLPSFVPMIGRSKMDLRSFGDELRVVAIRPKDLIVNGKLSCTAKLGLHEYYRLPGSTKIALVISAAEIELERLWRNHFEYDLIEQLSKLGLHAIIGPNFSVGADHPRLLHLINMRRNNILFYAHAKAQLPAVPDVSWYDTADLHRWIEWLRENEIHTVAVTLQCLIRDSRDLLRPLIQDLHVIRSEIGKNIKFVFIGANESIPELISEFGNLSVISFQPFVKAWFGRRLVANEGQRMKVEVVKAVPKETLFRENLMLYNEMTNAQIARTADMACV